MTWWFLILGVSTAAVVWAAIAIYVRVRRQLKSSHPHPTEDVVETTPKDRA